MRINMIAIPTATAAPVDNVCEEVGVFGAVDAWLFEVELFRAAVESLNTLEVLARFSISPHMMVMSWKVCDSLIVSLTTWNAVSSYLLEVDQSTSGVKVNVPLGPST